MTRRALTAALLLATLGTLMLLLTACGGGGDSTPTPYDECVAAQVGPQLPGVPVFACLGLEGAPTP